MTAPTQAQIEAAAKILWNLNHLPSSIWEEERSYYVELAEAACAAAAEAGEQHEDEIQKLRRQRIEFDCRYTMGNVADLTGSHCPIDRPCLRCQNERLEATTIERCAQEAERYDEVGAVIAAAIRAMKDKDQP